MILFKKISILTFAIFTFLYPLHIIKAFLPPEFFVQGLSSIWAVIAGGLAIALAPFLIFFRFVKSFAKKHKKIVLFIVLQNILLAIIVGTIFYYKFYQPLYYSSYIFPQNNIYENNEFKKSDLKILNPNYIVQNEYLRDKYNDKDIILQKYNIEIEELEMMILDNDKKINFIDIREIEEYQAGHIKGSIHYRGMDLTLQKIKEIFDLDEKEFNEQLFVLVCHDGGRGQIKAKEFNKENIKYLQGGIQIFADKKIPAINLTGPVFADYVIFDSKYQIKYQAKAEDVKKLMKESPESIFLIDGRHKMVYDKGHIKGILQLNTGRMTTKQYKENLEKVLQAKEKQIIVFCDRYADLFYANLLFLRLEKYHNFNNDQFNIIFHQLDRFKEDPEIKFVFPN